MSCCNSLKIENIHLYVYRCDGADGTQEFTQICHDVFCLGITVSVIGTGCLAGLPAPFSKTFTHQWVALIIRYIDTYIFPFIE